MLTFQENTPVARHTETDSKLTSRQAIGLVSLAEQERQYLVSILHDEVMQLDCQILRLLQEMLATAAIPQKVQENLVEVLDLMNMSMNYMRDVTEKFALPYIERESLVVAVRRLLWQAEKRNDVCCTLIIEGFADRQPLHYEQERVLYSIVREAVRNVLHHARARTLKVTLYRMPTVLFLNIEDNGCGFVIPAVGEVAPNRHLGLSLIRERVSEQGGTFLLESVPGQGTVLAIQLPVSGCERENANL